MSRAEQVMRLGFVCAILLTVVCVLAYALTAQAVGAVVKDADQAQGMTALLCIGGGGGLIIVLLIVGAVYLMLNRTLAMAVQGDGIKAMLVSSARDRDADADIKQAAISMMRQSPTGQWSYPANELPTYRPPTPQLVAPRVINVPRYIVAGQAQPIGAKQVVAPVLQTTVQDDDTGQDVALSIPLNVLMKFCGLATPSRAEWTGKRELYGECAKFYEAHGMLGRQQNGGYKWSETYPARGAARVAIAI